MPESDCCELPSESRRSPDAARCEASCRVLPSSERIFCLILAANEACPSSCSAVCGEGICGTEGAESSLASSPRVLKPVWERFSIFGWKSSSSAIVGSRAARYLETMGERSESCEYTESSLGRLADCCCAPDSNIMLSKPVGARERPLGRSPRPMVPR